MTETADLIVKNARVGLSLAMRLAVELDEPEMMGPSFDGDRRNYPITGGRFKGPRISGEVIGSGADIPYVRADGMCHIEAIYRIRADDGAIIVVHNTGLFEHPDFGRPDRPYLVTRPVFVAPDGAHDWLNKSLFIGTVDDMDGGVLVSVYEVSQFR